MSRLFLCRRAGPGEPDDILLVRDKTPPEGWRLRETIAATWRPSGTRAPYFAWRRRMPRTGHAITSGEVPTAVGDWSLDFVFYADRFNATPVEEVRQPRSVPAPELLLVKPLLLDFLDILNRHDFPYWADSGTMLGAMRHGGIIPWDKDCDLGILRKHKDALSKLIRTSAPGYDLIYTDHPTMWLTSTKYGIRISDVFKFTFMKRFRAKFWEEHAGRLGVDVSAGFLVYDNALFKRYQDQRFNLPWSLVHPTRLAPFYDRQIKVPNRARTLLRGMYGDDCFTRQSTDHMNSEGERITSFLPL